MGPLLVVAGSLREGRRSFAVAEHVRDRLHALGAEVELFDPRDYAAIPPFDQVTSTPETRRMIELFTNASGFVIVSPEWHSGIPGHLKNIIDYMGAAQFFGKPVALVAVSSAMGGTIALSSLRDIVGVLGATLVGPFLPVRNVQDAFDASTGRFADERFNSMLDAALKQLIRVRDATAAAAV